MHTLIDIILIKREILKVLMTLGFLSKICIGHILSPCSEPDAEDKKKRFPTSRNSQTKGSISYSHDIIENYHQNIVPLNLL